MKRSEKINNKDLKALGLYELDLLKSAGRICKKLINSKVYQKNELIELLKKLIENPEDYLDDATFGELAHQLKEIGADLIRIKQEIQGYELKPELPDYPVYGKSEVEEGALSQMNTAMKLPISIAGALMPDAHQGYGLPIGGVLATEADKIIPFAVGVDIACRMCMSIFDIPSAYLFKNKNKLKNFLLENTRFGTGKGFEKPMEDEVFDLPEWNKVKFIRELKSKAIAQVGSSGTGNHFVEWGMLEIENETNVFNLPKGSYLALLSHSGSRGFGANVAAYYSKLAMQITKLPDAAKHLAWLDLNTQEGQEYWIGMNLAGAYASANHHQIHKRMAKSLDTKPVLMIENHHNFAWKEKLEDGREVIVHRKGATPAYKGELGIIPGSMTAPGFVVSGKGNGKSIFSASHGAGRKMSRGKALKTFDDQDLNRALIENKVLLIGGDLDEAPMAYKDISQVMGFQSDLVEILAKFYPKIVRMAEKERKKWGMKSKEDLYAES